MILSAQQKQDYLDNGFLVINNFISTTVCELLKTRAESLIQAFEPPAQMTVFETATQTHAKHQYFLESGDKIHFFFEQNAFDSQGHLIKEKALSINKIGHALHDLDPTFNCFSRQHKIAKIVNDLDIPNPLLMQSMYLCKQPFIGGEVTCHQDSTYLYTKEQPVTGLWFALEDATLSNGCLWAIPGGHKGPLKSRSMVKDGTMHMEVFDETPWHLEKMVPLEVPQGGLVILHGLLPHMSKENISERSRHAYSLHIISGNETYPKDNWLQGSFKGFI